MYCFYSKKGGNVHKLIAANKSSKALGTDRRDDLRYNLRAKLSSKDYMDKEMRQFYYQKQNNQVNAS